MVRLPLLRARSVQPRSAGSSFARLLTSDRQAVRWTPHAKGTTSHHVRVNHRRADILVPQQLLHRADVRPAFQKVRRKAVAKYMTRNPLLDACQRCRLHDSLLHRRLVQPIPARRPPPRIPADTSRREHKLPPPLGVRVRVLPCQRIRQNHPPVTGRQIALVLTPDIVQEPRFAGSLGTRV
jgi:hypothetical protein